MPTYDAVTFSREITLLQGNLMATEKLEDKYIQIELLFCICVWCACRCVHLLTCVWVYMFVWVLKPMWVHARVWCCMLSSIDVCLIHWDRFFQWTYRQKTTGPLMTQRKDGEYNYKTKISNTFLQLEIFKAMSALFIFWEVHICVQCILIIELLLLLFQPSQTPFPWPPSNLMSSLHSPLSPQCYLYAYGAVLPT